jgi:hypothetical protein
MRIDGNGQGNVGIGETSPGSRLQVNGNIRVSNGTTFPTGNSLIRSIQAMSGSANQFVSSSIDFYTAAFTDNGQIAFSTGGVEAMRINGSSQVGIGTSSPGAALDVSSFSDTKILLTHNNSSTRRSFIGSNAGSSGSYNALILGSNATDKGTQSNTGLASWYQEFGPYDVSGNAWKVLYQAAGGAVTERMRIDEAGNLGVGTSSPTDFTPFGFGPTIETKGGHGGSFIVTSGDGTLKTVLSNNVSQTAGFLKTLANHPLAFGTNDTERMRIDSSGNVGIGTASPASKLNVAGGNVTVSAGYGIAWSGDQTRIMTPEDNVVGALINWGAGGGCRAARQQKINRDPSLQSAAAGPHHCPGVAQARAVPGNL